MSTNIPKVIHYIWFGKNKKNKLILKCIGSWEKNLKDFEIKEWNENNFNIKNQNKYFQLAYQNKKWAFASDYARLKILYEYGGIYLDTDMYVIKNFNFLNYDLVLGKEDENYISAGMIACTPQNIFIKKCIEYYDNNPNKLITIPKVLTKIFKENESILKNYKVFEPIYFYPFDANNIKNFNFQNAPQKTYAVHMWNYSWGHPLNKLIKKLELHKHLKNISEKLEVKEKIKKILKMQ